MRSATVLSQNRQMHHRGVITSDIWCVMLSVVVVVYLFFSLFN